MDQTIQQQLKNTQATFWFALLSAGYFMSALLTSMPHPDAGHKLSTVQMTPQSSVSTKGADEPRVGHSISQKSASSARQKTDDGAGRDEKWWRSHQLVVAKRSQFPALKPSVFGLQADRRVDVLTQTEAVKIAAHKPVLVPARIARDHPLEKPTRKAKSLAAGQNNVASLAAEVPTGRLKPVFPPVLSASGDLLATTKPEIASATQRTMASVQRLSAKAQRQELSLRPARRLISTPLAGNLPKHILQPSGDDAVRQCFEGKIAGWSGVKMFPRFEDLLKQSDIRQSEISTSLVARLTANGFTPGAPIHMRIFKDRSKLEIWLKKGARYALYRSFDICRWSGSFGPKLYEGDKQSPEGFYSVDNQLFNRRSWKWKNSFSIGYPNAYDKLHGRTGSLILVHGGCTSSGCFAMTNPVINEVHELAQLARDNGQQEYGVHVYPFRLTSANLRRHKNSPWMPFWKNLKEGYDLFETTGLPPKVKVCNKRYVFSPAGIEREGTGWSGKGCYGLAAYIPGWKPARRYSSNARRRTVRWKRSSARSVRCNLSRASCRKWLSLNRRKAGRSVRKRHVSRRQKRRAKSANRTVARKKTRRLRSRRIRARAIGPPQTICKNPAVELSLCKGAVLTQSPSMLSTDRFANGLSAPHPARGKAFPEPPAFLLYQAI